MTTGASFQLSRSAGHDRHSFQFANRPFVWFDDLCARVRE